MGIRGAKPSSYVILKERSQVSQSRSGFSRTWQQFQNAFLLAADSIRGHKLRSFLTLLGVIIGVPSVIMVGRQLRA
jgi:hypothetical protein